MASGRLGIENWSDDAASLAERMGQGIERSSRFELLTPVRLNIVGFALRGAKTSNVTSSSGKAQRGWAGIIHSNVLRGEASAIRAAFVNWSTSEQDIPVILDALERMCFNTEVIC